MHSHSGEMLEWLKRHAWKACIRQNRISGSNPATKKTAAFLQNAAFFAPSASSSLAKPEAWKSHDMLRISAVLSQPFLLVARAPRRALRECAALQGEHNPDEGAWRVLRLQARLQSRRCGKAMICSAYQPFCPSRSSWGSVAGLSASSSLAKPKARNEEEKWEFVVLFSTPQPFGFFRNN